MAHDQRTPLVHASPDDSQHGGDDVNVGAVFKFCLALIVVGAVIHLVVWVLFQGLAGREAARVIPEYPLAVGQETRLPPEPRLQTDPRADLRALRDHEASVLSNYSWVDRNAGIVRIPIEEAIKATAKRGLPARPASEQPK